MQFSYTLFDMNKNKVDTHTRFRHTAFLELIAGGGSIDVFNNQRVDRLKAHRGPDAVISYDRRIETVADLKEFIKDFPQETRVWAGGEFTPPAEATDDRVLPEDVVWLTRLLIKETDRHPGEVRRILSTMLDAVGH